MRTKRIITLAGVLTIGLAGILIVTALTVVLVDPWDVRTRFLHRYRENGTAGILRAAANRIKPPEPPPIYRPLSVVLAKLAEGPSLSIVQIGAYIGDTPNDPLFKFLQSHVPVRAAANLDTKVVLVEPIREYFDQLRENYAGLPQIELENLAISEREGVLEMYTLSVDPTEYGYPAWLSQLSSLKKDRMEELWGHYERNRAMQAFYLKHREVERVKAVPLWQLLEQHEFSNVDLLQIDAEGYDYEILKSLDFDKTKPRFINYERVLLAEQEPDCREMLAGHGYVLLDWGQDTLAILIT